MLDFRRSEKVVRLVRQTSLSGELAIVSMFPPSKDVIDACGENFGSLDKRHDGWLARANGHQHCFAGTPAEAVARLWLQKQ
jgi:hypothetical protein